MTDYGHHLDPLTQACERCGKDASEIAEPGPRKGPEQCTAAIEKALLERLHSHQSATVDDLFDVLPSEEVKCLIAGLGRKAVRIEVDLTTRKKARAEALKTVEN